jgi:hypothetical protein
MTDREALPLAGCETCRVWPPCNARMLDAAHERASGDMRRLPEMDPKEVDR